MNETTQFRIVNSALWAAAADALGFISELTDAAGLRRRVHAARVSQLIQWPRLVGGRYGAQVVLPPGCYSDDTQLRLATSRAIRGNGYFDVESLAKIELPVWLCYSLGGGAGTKAAAANLASADVSWFSNFYEGRERSYLNSGGNGAAMRVQPHVWAAKQRDDPKTFLTDVVRNSICTHGSLRAIVGAVVHAMILAKAIDTGKVQPCASWREALAACRGIGDLIRSDREMSSFWLPVWEQRAGKPFAAELDRVVEECIHDLGILEAHEITDDVSYRSVVESIGGLEQDTRGSGTKTALIAGALAWTSDRLPAAGIVSIAANLLGSDTDTIGTMAGAILGATTEREPIGPILDREYIAQEANRLYQISTGLQTPSFAYPDLMKWSPPRNQTSGVGMSEGKVFVAGLGKASPTDETFRGQGREGAVWRWLKLDFGQTVIAKMRSGDLPQLAPSSIATVTPRKNKVEPMVNAQQNSLFGQEPEPKSTDDQARRESNLDDITNDAIQSGFDPATIGKHIIELSSNPDGIERCLAYVAIISKAKKARLARLRP